MLVGAPNTGKTTLFNALTGQTAQVSNYPGVTVDRRFGRILNLGASGANAPELVDAPGTDSLSVGRGCSQR